MSACYSQKSSDRSSSGSVFVAEAAEISGIDLRIKQLEIENLEAQASAAVATVAFYQLLANEVKRIADGIIALVSPMIGGLSNGHASSNSVSEFDDK